MSRALVEAVQARFGAKIIESTSQHGDEAIVIEPSAWVEVHRFLRDQCACDMLIDLCGVDYPDREPRFEVVVHVYSTTQKHRLRTKARVGDAEGIDVELDTLTGVWLGANWLERECFDLMGVRFRGHPDLRRILMYDEFEGHPLRKDYPAQKTQPLIPYRDGPGILDKLAPFASDEGMPWGRQSHDRTPRSS
jgi:NADH-quinone oxidoreductase subunit C